MNIKIKEFLSNFSITLIANLLSMVVSSMVVLIVPTVIGVTDYGYWQLYIFYCSYTSYFSFGLTDGVYLRNGGKKFKDLDFDNIRPQYIVLIVLNIILTIVVTISFIIQNSSMNKIMIVFLACFSAIIIIPRSLLTMTMLSVNRIKENALVLITDRAIYFVLIIMFFVFKINNFYFLIFADLFGQFISALLAIYLCKDLVIGRINVPLKKILEETKINISIGIKIVLAGLASMLIVGIIRIGIEQHWGVAEFAKVSLTISVCNLFLVFIKAISVVIFPVLCNCYQETLKKIYLVSRNSLAIVLLGSFIFYYPLRIILSSWLPNYSESLMYMAILFPISLYESKTQLLLNTYFKALRKENTLLLVNIITVALSFICSIISINIFNSIDLAILSIVILLAFRCYLSEIFLIKLLDINSLYDVFLEIMITALFIILNWNIGGIQGMLLYSFLYIVYIYLKRNDLKYLFANFKTILFKEEK